MRERRRQERGPEKGKTGVPLTMVCVIKTKNWSPVVQLDGTRTCKIHHIIGGNSSSCPVSRLTVAGEASLH